MTANAANHRVATMNTESFRCFLGSKFGWAITLSLAVLGVYLLWNHTGHVVYALPYLFLLACPLMHVFGHHHGHDHKQENTK
jgi:hypothetical protein